MAWRRNVSRLEPKIRNARPAGPTAGATPRSYRSRLFAAAVFASRGDSVEIREVRQSVLTPRPGDPDAAAYAEGAVLPNPGAKLAGPTFEEWLAAG